MNASSARAGPRDFIVAKPRWPLFDRYLAANLMVWGVTYVGASVRSLGMGTSLDKLLGLGLRRAQVSAVGAC